MPGVNPEVGDNGSHSLVFYLAREGFALLLRFYREQGPWKHPLSPLATAT